MDIDENLATIHAYLCADGYVIKNPENQKHKYYRIGLRNTNLILLEDFQKRFEKVFSIRPRLVVGQRCEIGSREIYEKLTKEFGSFYSWKWRMPNLNEVLSKVWLRTYFDCESWVFCKTHQNRHIGIDCVNEFGLNQIIKSLKLLGIKTVKKSNKKRKIHRILIYGKENILTFKEKIGFNHPDKKIKLDQTISDFINYDWNVNNQNFVEILKKRLRIKKPKYLRVISKEETNLTKLNEFLIKKIKIEGIIHKRMNGLGTIYFELNINKKKDVTRLIKLGMVPNIENV